MFLWHLEKLYHGEAYTYKNYGMAIFIKLQICYGIPVCDRHCTVIYFLEFTVKEKKMVTNGLFQKEENIG